MYPPNQPKSLLVRPRSSLSTAPDDKRIRRGCCTKSFTSLEGILCGCCLALFIFCGILFSALIYVGSLVNNSTLATYTTDKLSFNTYFDKNVINTNKNNINNNNSRSSSINNNYSNNNTEEYVIKLKPKEIFKITKEDIFNIKSHIKIESTNTNNTSINSTLKMSESADTVNKKNKSDNIGFNLNSLEMSKILNKLKFRLPREIIPQHYDLYLYPNLKEKNFYGNVSIKINIIEPINFIPVHSKLLNITESKLIRIDNDGQPTNPIYPINNYAYEPYEYWVMEFKQNLFVGEYWINFTFNGSLKNRIVGFYQSSYFDKLKNSTRYIATSKFEPTYARQAFPCFDEPDMKAKYTVTLVRPTDDYIALSNMDIEKEEKFNDGSLTKTIFKESVKMSTYLVCFIVSDFKYKSDVVDTKGIGDKFDLRVFATPAQLEKVQYALEVGKTITEYYISYFKIPYPLPKLDMAAIPDFVSGAMEHWGLVTFRETSLLYDREISSTTNKQRVGSVVAHELAHMWFGNLVTMKWWNDLWLNEGFASYIQYKGLDAAHPDWKLLDQFLIDGFHDVLTLDATLASHPIVQTVETPDQITELFDKITYQKGAAIIRMLEDFVGSDKFQNAVTNYLNKFKYNNAETKDLLAEIASIVPDIDVELIMRTWTVQMGFPVVNVKKGKDPFSFILTQKRFLANSEDEEKEHERSQFNYKWEIPITYVTEIVKEEAKEETKHVWFHNTDANATIQLTEDYGSWIKFNKNQVGYYRINYSEELWQGLILALMDRPNVFSVSDRAHLLNDAFALSDATQLDYRVSLDLTKYLIKEDEYVPWAVAAKQLKKMKNLLQKSNSNEKFIKYVRSLVKEIGTNPQQGHLFNLLRTTILDLACSFGQQQCLDTVKVEFQQWLETSKIKPDIKAIAYKYGMQEMGTEMLWDKVWIMYKNEIDAGEKVKLMSSLASIKDVSILQKFINLAWDESNVRRQDYFSCLQMIASNEAGESLVWDYVRENWLKLVDRFTLNDRYLGNLIPAITSQFSLDVKLRDMEEFFEKYPDAGAGVSGRNQAIANVKNNIKWLMENEKKISDWLDSEQY